MDTQIPIDYLFRVGDGGNFWNSSHLRIWGTKGLAGLKEIKKGDRMWFITNNSGGHIIAVSTFDMIIPRTDSSFSDEELGWTGNGGWDYEIHYNNLYNVSNLNYLTNIKNQNSVSKATEKCQVNLPKEYSLIVQYSNAVYLPCGKMAAWRFVGGTLNNLKTLQVHVATPEIEVAMPRVEVIDSPVKELLATLIPKVEIINLPAKELMAKADPNNKSENLSIKDALEHLFKQYNIETKTELDLWCGKSRKKLYNYVKNMAPEHWNLIKTPESSVRAAYEVRLSGYKISKDNKSM